MKSLILKKPLTEERRTKKSLDSPQTIEANNNILKKDKLAIINLNLLAFFW